MRERGLKLNNYEEISIGGEVAPVRERGLKLLNEGRIHQFALGRSREGAWIEIS